MVVCGKGTGQGHAIRCRRCQDPLDVPASVYHHRLDTRTGACEHAFTDTCSLSLALSSARALSPPSFSPSEHRRAHIPPRHQTLHQTVKLLDTWEPRRNRGKARESVCAVRRRRGKARGKARAGVARPGPAWQGPGRRGKATVLATGARSLPRALPRSPGPCHGRLRWRPPKPRFFGACYRQSEVPRCLGVSLCGPRDSTRGRPLAPSLSPSPPHVF